MSSNPSFHVSIEPTPLKPTASSETKGSSHWSARKKTNEPVEPSQGSIWGPYIVCIPIIVHGKCCWHDGWHFIAHASYGTCGFIPGNAFIIHSSPAAQYINMRRLPFSPGWLAGVSYLRFFGSAKKTTVLPFIVAVLLLPVQLLRYLTAWLVGLQSSGQPGMC